jgi:hypothetical protein
MLWQRGRHTASVVLRCSCSSSVLKDSRCCPHMHAIQGFRRAPGPAKSVSPALKRRARRSPPSFPHSTRITTFPTCAWLSKCRYASFASSKPKTRSITGLIPCNAIARFIASNISREPT